MKKKLFLLLLLLFALFAVVYVIPQILDGTLPLTTGSRLPETEISGPEMETMEEKTFPYETVWTESEPETEETMPPETDDTPGEPVEREKIVTDIIFVSDIHYMSPDLTDYGTAFNELIDNGDGKVVAYMPQIWQAFAEEVIASRPDALVLSGDLTINGERVNHEELAKKLEEIEAAGVSVLVIPGNHDINNPYATAYFGESQSFIEGVDPVGFWEIYRKYGYDEAAGYAPDSMSYLYILNDTTWLMMLDTCIYEPDNEVDGEIPNGTMEWMEEWLKSAYAEGITVIPVGHHNLQELSRVYVEECVLRNHQEVMEIFERYLTPVYFSGHLHVQRIMKHISEPGITDEIYGIWEIVSNSLIIPPCQYGNLTLNANGSLSYHTRNVDISSWAAKHGETNLDLLDFPAFSDTYIRSVIGRQAYKTIEDIPDELREVMTDFYVDLYQDYYAGRHINYSERRKEFGYQLWTRFMDPSVQYRQVEGMLRDGMAGNNHVVIPNPIFLERE